MPETTPGVGDPDRLWTVDDVATFLSVDKSWVYAAAEKGTVPSFRIGKYRRFSRAAIEAWVLKQQDTKLKAV